MMDMKQYHGEHLMEWIMDKDVDTVREYHFHGKSL